jgi:hypothetical protein
VRLYKSKEQYYKTQFESWGKYCSKFAWSDKALKRHDEFISWLFPVKNFEEWSDYAELNEN